jgi:hypothetical protein
MKSSYQLRNITTRTTYANGNSVTPGPPVSATYPLGYFREDYEYIPTSAATPDYLDEHNGRFCVTPEYPNGIYAYFATVNSTWNSAYPYVVGPTFYGVKTAAKVTSITEPVTIYVPSSTGITENNSELPKVNVYPNPAGDLVAIQMNNLSTCNIRVELFDLTGRLIEFTEIFPGSTIAYFDTQRLYNGDYLIRVKNEKDVVTKKISIIKN